MDTGNELYLTHKKKLTFKPNVKSVPLRPAGPGLVTPQEPEHPWDSSPDQAELKKREDVPKTHPPWIWSAWTTGDGTPLSNAGRLSHSSTKPRRPPPKSGPSRLRALNRHLVTSLSEVSSPYNLLPPHLPTRLPRHPQHRLHCCLVQNTGKIKENPRPGTHHSIYNSGTQLFSTALDARKTSCGPEKVLPPCGHC